MLSSLYLEPSQYANILHYFRSTGYTTSNIYEKWISIAEKETPFTTISGYTVLLGDHIKISKEGRRMPDIQILHQESENSGKGKCIEGHMYAQVSAVISKDGVSRSLPLMTQQQQSPPKKEGSKTPDGDTLVTQMVKLVVEVVNALDESHCNKVVVALDAYFSKSAAFLASDAAVDEEGNHLLTIVTRGRDDSVGYKPPAERPKGKRGRSLKYGEKVVLRQLFSDMSKFTDATLTLYGKPSKVKYQCLDLYWKPLGRYIRFVVVEAAGRGKMILMCNDLTMKPEDIITVYSLRFKIETGFDEQKNDIGSFSYHFWTKALEKRTKWKKSELAIPSDKPKHVDSARRAIDSFVCMGTIAAGISTILAFSHNRQIWNHYSGWIKTRRSHIPSVAITKAAFANYFHVFATYSPELEICSVINKRKRDVTFLFSDFDDAA
jgi:hypothetical protein